MEVLFFYFNCEGVFIVVSQRIVPDFSSLLVVVYDRQAGLLLVAHIVGVYGGRVVASDF